MCNVFLHKMNVSDERMACMFSFLPIHLLERSAARLVLSRLLTSLNSLMETKRNITHCRRLRQIPLGWPGARNNIAQVRSRQLRFSLHLHLRLGTLRLIIVFYTVLSISIDFGTLGTTTPTSSREPISVLLARSGVLSAGIC